MKNSVEKAPKAYKTTRSSSNMFKNNFHRSRKGLANKGVRGAKTQPNKGVGGAVTQANKGVAWR